MSDRFGPILGMRRGASGPARGDHREGARLITLAEGVRQAKRQDPRGVVEAVAGELGLRVESALIYTAPTPALVCLVFDDADPKGLLLFTPADTELLAKGSVPPQSIAICSYAGRR